MENFIIEENEKSLKLPNPGDHELLETLETKDFGNTKIQNPSIKKQSIQRINHRFTFFDYTKEDINLLETFFKEMCFKYCFQEEKCPTTDREHLQGVFSLKKRARWQELGLPNTIHFDKCDKPTFAYEYCSKIATRNGKIYYMNFEPKVPCIDLIEPNKPWQQEILNIIETKPDTRKVYWYWSIKGGVGKSQFCKYLLVKHKCVFIDEGKKSDIMHCIMTSNMIDKNIVIFDVPRDNGNKISYKSIESIKNGMIFSSKYESGYKIFNSPHLIVFANCEPEYSSLSDDRWVVKNIDE